MIKDKRYKYFGDLQNEYKLFDKAFIKRVAKFGIPMGISAIIMSLMSVIDKLFIGQASSLDGAVGHYALGATFIATWYFTLVTMIIMGFSSMASVVATQYFGAKKYDKSEQGLRLSLTFGFTVAIIGIIIAQVIPNDIASLLGKTSGTSDAVKANVKYGPDYLKVISITGILFVVTNHLTTVYAWNEKTKVVLYMTIIALGFNALFDYLFMFTFGFGVVGCAWSTVMVEAFMVISLFTFLSLQKHYKGTFNPFKNITNYSWDLNKQILSKSMLFINQISFTSLMTVSQILIARAYVDGPTIQGVVSPFTSFFLIAMSGVLGTMRIIIGKDLGQKNFGAAYANSIRITVYALIVAIIGMLLFIAASPGIPYAFSVGREDADIRKQAIILISIMSSTYVFWIWAQGYGTPLRIGGRVGVYFITSAGTAFIDFIIALIIFLTMPSFDFWIAFLIWKSSRILRVGITYFFFRKQTWVRTLVKE